MGAIWNWLVSRVSTDARVAREAPLAFALCVTVGVCVIGLMMWSILDFKYAAQIDNANSLNAYLTRQLDDTQKELQRQAVASKRGQSVNSRQDDTSINALQASSSPHFCGGGRAAHNKITPFHSYSRTDLIKAVYQISFKLENIEIERNRNIFAASSLEANGKAVNVIAERQKAIEAAEAASTRQFHDMLIGEVRPLYDELHMRLKIRYPASEDDGIASSGMEAYCSGILFGQNPLTELTSYLKSLAGRLPSQP